MVQGRTIQAAEVTELAQLPGKPELYAKLLFLLSAPMVRLVTVLNAAPRALLNVLDAGGEEEGRIIDLGGSEDLSYTPQGHRPCSP